MKKFFITLLALVLLCGGVFFGLKITSNDDQVESTIEQIDTTNTITPDTSFVKNVTDTIVTAEIDTNIVIKQ